MATQKQRDAVDKLVENRGASVSGVMREVGYDDTTAKNPKNLTDSKGFQELMDEYLPETLLITALQTDIKAKVGNRKPEIELGFKLRGLLTEKIDHTTKGEQLHSSPELAAKFDKFLENENT